MGESNNRIIRYNYLILLFIYSQEGNNHYH